RPPPNSTLFPYTTLFRSGTTFRGSWEPCLADCDHAVSASNVCVMTRAAQVAARWCNVPPQGQVSYLVGTDPELLKIALDPLPDSDRKSTRLNSSHLVISY